MSSALTSYVPIMTGTNYQAWKAKMQAYLGSVDLWLVANGSITCPVQAGDPQTQWDVADA